MITRDRHVDRLRHGVHRRLNRIRWARSCPHRDLVRLVLDDDLEGAAEFLRRHGGHGVDLTLLHPQLVHQLRQRVHRWRPEDQMSSATPWAAAVERDGIVAVPGFVGGATLQALQRDMEHFVGRLAGLDQQPVFEHYDVEEHVNPAQGAYTSNNALAWSPTLLATAARLDVVTNARTYMGGEVWCQRATAMRYLPQVGPALSQFRWHHDLDDRQFKLMILLTDVGPDDQPMRYLTGSHRSARPYGSFHDNLVEPTEQRDTTPFLATGQAGDAVLFDPNGTHSASRSEHGAVRDVMTIGYTVAPSLCFGATPDPAEVALLDSGVRSVFQPALSQVPLWDRRPRRTRTLWNETLYDPSGWRLPA